jgi:hypothetical protein
MTFILRVFRSGTTYLIIVFSKNSRKVPVLVLTEDSFPVKPEITMPGLRGSYSHQNLKILIFFLRFEAEISQLTAVIIHLFFDAAQQEFSFFLPFPKN